MYRVKFTDKALKTLQQMDKQIVKMIFAWIEKHLEGCDDPRVKGKGLSHNKRNIWRYRVGQYQLLANIQEDELIILVIDVGLRKEIYH